MEFNICIGCGSVSYNTAKCPVCERTVFKKVQVSEDFDLETPRKPDPDSKFIFPTIEVSSKAGNGVAKTEEELSAILLKIGATFYMNDIIEGLKKGQRSLELGNRITGRVSVRVLDPSAAAPA